MGFVKSVTNTAKFSVAWIDFEWPWVNVVVEFIIMYSKKYVFIKEDSEFEMLSYKKFNYTKFSSPYMYI